MLTVTRLKILMNIGIAFIKMSQFADAASSFEAIMEVSPDHHAGKPIFKMMLSMKFSSRKIIGFNLILCYYALGDRERMKKGFQKMLAIRPPLIDKSEETTINTKNEPIHDHDVFTQDRLRALSKEKYVHLITLQVSSADDDPV